MISTDGEPVQGKEDATEDRSWEAMVVRALYRALLFREPEPTGLRDGIELVRDGDCTIDELIRGCLRSEEFASNYNKFIRTYVRSEHLPLLSEASSSQKSPASPSVSGVMIAYNAEPFLSVTLPTLCECFEQLIIVDMGSTDQSQLLYEKYLGDGDAVIFYDRRNLFQFGFSHPRNYGSKFATSDWIFSIDTDELIVPEEFMLARSCLSQTDHVSFSVVRRNYEYDPGLSIPDVATIIGTCSFKEEKHRRIYRNIPQIRFEGIIHEELGSNDERLYHTAGDAPVILHHLSRYSGAIDSGEKSELYAFPLLRASTYPRFRFGTNSWWFAEYVPQNLAMLLGQANRFAARYGLSGFSPSELPPDLMVRSKGAL